MVKEKRPGKSIGILDGVKSKLDQFRVKIFVFDVSVQECISEAIKKINSVNFVFY